MEDILEEIQWVRSLRDPDLNSDQLHDAFLKLVMFHEPREETDGSRVVVVNRAKERKREQRKNKELRAELEELQADYAVSSNNEEGELSESVDHLSGEEDDETDDYLAWIDPQNVDITKNELDDQSSQEEPVAESTLRRLSKSKIDDNVYSSLPERLGAIAVGEKRPNLGPKQLSNGLYCKLSLEHKAYWILRQLGKPGKPLGHNTRICALSKEPLERVINEPIVVSLCYALDKMINGFIEPAVLMMYHQTQLHPLLHALLDRSSLLSEAEQSIPVVSFAYSAATGRRQLPEVSEHYVGFGKFADRSIGTGDGLWKLEGNDFCVRKPCFIELGRLLVQVLELEVLCTKLEHQRQEILLRLRGSDDTATQNMASTLETIVFESATEADLWWKVVNTRNAEAKYTTSTLKKLGLEDAFDEFSISPLRFQENLTGQKERLLCSNVSLPFEEWLKSVADAVNMDPEGVSTLFLNVVAEEFSSLPILCKNVIDLFCNAGDLIVTSRGSEEQQVYPMTEFFTTYPTKIFSLLEKERTGKVFLNFTLDLNGLCNYLNSYFQNSGNSPDSWFRERESAMRLLSLKLKKNLVTSIKSTLVENANFHLSVDGMRFLDTICSLGPYERTFLNIEPFSDTEHSWNPEWNVVEALPSSEPALGFQRHKRICGAFREQNGVTAFCVVDEYGNLCDHTLWADCSLEKDTGRYRKQQEALKRIIVDHSPSMIVVGASGVHSLVLMRMMSDFIKDASFDFEISVVWGATRVASCYSTTQQALRQLGNYDSIIRTAIGLARFAQDPLLTLCALFDEERSVLQILPLDQYSDRFQSRLYSSLCWNMTLWVAAVGCGVDQCIKRPDSVLFIQFIPGLGASTGRVFFDQLVRQTNVTKDSLKLLLADSFDESVCSNALDFFRFPLSLEEPHTNLNAYLDQTLIPDVWRDAAYFILDQLEQNIPNFVKAEMGLFAVSERREMIYESMDAQYLLSLVKSSMLSCRNVIGLREVEFILDEFIALGASMMRRPYRRMSSHEVMLNVTGILYSDRPRTQHGVLPTDSRSLLVCRRDYVFGSVHAVRMGSEPGVMFLSSFGIRAFVSVNSFPDSMKDELFQCIEEASTDPRAERPVWMRRGCPIQGIVTNCLWSRCELAVTWCPQREGQRITTIRRPLFAASHDAESSVNSVKTVALQRSALKYSRKISSHPLFRDVSPNEISEMLRERKIGEVLFCISTRNEKPVCAIKISHLQSSNWEVEEKRKPNGSIYFEVHDRIEGSSLSYDDADELISKFVNPMIELVHGIRRHRRFIKNYEDVSNQLAERARFESTFPYAFTEVQGKRPYRILIGGTKKNREFELHVTNQSVYVHLPLPSNGKMVRKWVKCRNAEHVSAVVKTYVSGLSGMKPAEE